MDAIHLATARIFDGELDGFATYDDRLAEAVTKAELALIRPEDE